MFCTPHYLSVHQGDPAVSSSEILCYLMLQGRWSRNPCSLERLEIRVTATLIDTPVSVYAVNLSNLIVQAVVVSSIPKAIAIGSRRIRLLLSWELEERTASRLLHSLCKGLVSSDLNIAD